MKGTILANHPKLEIKVRAGDQPYYSQYTVEEILKYIDKKTISLDILKEILSEIPDYEKSIEGVTVGSDHFFRRELKKRGYEV